MQLLAYSLKQHWSYLYNSVVRQFHIRQFFGSNDTIFQFILIFSQPVPLRGRAETGSHNFVCVCVCMSAVISSSSSSSVSLSPHPPLRLLQSFQCRGGIISDLCSLCRSQSLGTSHSTVCCTILSVQRCSLGNTSLHRDKMTPPLQEYSSVLYYTILYYTKRFV